MVHGFSGPRSHRGARNRADYRRRRRRTCVLLCHSTPTSRPGNAPSIRPVASMIRSCFDRPPRSSARHEPACSSRARCKRPGSEHWFGRYREDLNSSPSIARCRRRRDREHRPRIPHPPPKAPGIARNPCGRSFPRGCKMRSSSKPPRRPGSTKRVRAPRSKQPSRAQRKPQDWPKKDRPAWSGEQEADRPPAQQKLPPQAQKGARGTRAFSAQSGPSHQDGRRPPRSGTPAPQLAKNHLATRLEESLPLSQGQRKAV